MESDLRRWITLCETEGEPTPITAWADIQTGVPATFHGWRGINGGRTPLAQHNRESLGRDWLLGDGIYVAPTRHMAAKYGAPVTRQIVLKNPYAIRIPPRTGWIWVIKQIDLAAIQQAYDGIVIVEGKTQYREDIRQAVVFAPYADQVQPIPKRGRTPP